MKFACFNMCTDGVYSSVRMDDRLCLLVIIGVTKHGGKEWVAVKDGYRESTASREELLVGLRERMLDTLHQNIMRFFLYLVLEFYQQSPVHKAIQSGEIGAILR